MALDIDVGLLTADEEVGLLADLPNIFNILERRGFLSVPATQWTKEEMLLFGALIVRAAVPLRVHAGRDIGGPNDEIPF